MSDARFEGIILILICVLDGLRDTNPEAFSAIKAKLEAAVRLCHARGKQVPLADIMDLLEALSPEQRVHRWIEPTHE